MKCSPQALPEDQSQQPTLRQWLAKEPFALALSSGFFGFFAHAGVMQALEEERLLPVRIAGSSAGALVGGLWAAGLSARQIQEALLAIRREDFWDPGPGLGLLRGRKFRALLQGLIPVDDFARTRVPLAVSVYDLLSRRTRITDSGPLVPALHAACAVPFLFQPVWLGLRPSLDGGVGDRHGIRGIPEGTRLFCHHLSSRSPWRRKNSPALLPVVRPDTVSLVLDGLPRSGPFRLEQGEPACRLAYQATKRALDRPIRSGVVRLQVVSGP